MKNNSDADIPHISAARMAKGVPFLKRRGRGRPRGSQKSMVSIRIDSDVYSWLKSGGPGYQSKINAILRQLYDISHGSRAQQDDAPEPDSPAR